MTRQSTHVSVGDAVTLATDGEGKLGTGVVKERLEDGTINMTLTIPPEKLETQVAQSLLRLADAAEQLAFASMDDEEGLLESLGLSLLVASPDGELRLGRDFSSIYVNPTLTHLSIALRAPPAFD